MECYQCVQWKTLMLKRGHCNKRLTFIFYKPKKTRKDLTCISGLVKATGYVIVVDASAVNAELESFSKTKRRKGSSYNISIPSRVKE